MSFFEEFTDLMPFEDIILHQHGNYSQSGEELPAEELVVQGYIDGKSQRVVNDEGVEVTSNSSVYLATTVEITPETKVTLPTGYFPRERLPIISVMRLADETGPAAMVLFV